MKMRKDDFEALRGLIRAHPLGTHKQVYLDRGLSQTRFVFDHLWAIPNGPRQEWFDRGIYTYLDDTHIETALRRIVKELSHD